ncbi:MAG: OprO/OprP family phosphate-selective porin [Phenylobacterium sp.]|uniref:OprO/OprP family phosphate-selective porin n=1 Tax=Phenylobacterium sp. TaxID=1871053 RepID=UPI00391B7075
MAHRLTRAQTLLLTGAASLAFAAPAAAQTDLPPEVAARLEAQEARIRELEARLLRLEAARAPSPAGGETAPPAAPAAPPVALAASSPAPAPAAPAKTQVRAAAEPPKIRGRAQFDALVYNDDDGSRATGTEVRRFYLGAQGKLGNGFAYVAEADFSGAEVGLQDVALSYQATPDLELVVGHFKPPITADELTSDAYTVFLERSAYAGTFAPGRRLGLAFNYAGEDWGLRGGAFGEQEDAALDGERDEAWLVALRGHRDLLPGEPALHVALSSYFLRPSDANGDVRLSQRPETGRAPRIIDTGGFLADEALFLGGELGYGAGPLTLQLEGGSIAYEGPFASPRFAGWSAQAAWRWTGEARPYDAADGVFGRIRPDRPLGDGGFGALETALRMTQVDLSDDAVTGGELTTFGAVVNWLPITRVRISANLIRASTEREGRPDVDETLVTLRTGVDW